MAVVAQERRAPPSVLIVTGADHALGAAVVAAARRNELPVLACGADQSALAALAAEGVVPLTLSGADPEQLRVLLAVIEDRFGGVLGVVHAGGHGDVPVAPGATGDRLAAVIALSDALPEQTPQALVLEESGRQGDPAAPLRAAASGALAAWAKSISGGPRIVWVPVGASPEAWALRLLRAARPARPMGLRGRLADSARRLVGARG